LKIEGVGVSALIFKVFLVWILGSTGKNRFSSGPIGDGKSTWFFWDTAMCSGDRFRLWWLERLIFRIVSE